MAIGTFGGDSFALDINNNGIVIGRSKTLGGFLAQDRAFLYDGAFHNINDLLNQSDPVAMLTNVTQALAINDNDDVLAVGTVLAPGGEIGELVDTGERHAYLLTAGQVGLPDPIVEVEAFARHATNDAGTAGPITGTVLVAVEQTANRPEATGSEQNNFGPFDRSHGRAGGCTDSGQPQRVGRTHRDFRL